MFPNFNTKAFNITMNSLKEASSITINYKNHEVNLKMNSDKESEDSAKDLIQELKEENNIHLNILLYLFIILFVICLICASMYIVKNKRIIHPLINRRCLTHVPPLQQMKTPSYKDPALELYHLNSTKIYPKFTQTSVPV